MDKRSCDNCILKKQGDCFGQAHACSDYKHSPSMTDDDRENWPKQMAFRDYYNNGFQRNRIKDDRPNKKMPNDFAVKEAINDSTEREISRERAKRKREENKKKSNHQKLPMEVYINKIAKLDNVVWKKIKRNINCLQIFVYIRVSDDYTSTYSYRMLYKGRYRDTKSGEVFPGRTKCAGTAMLEAVKRITRRTEVVIYLPEPFYFTTEWWRGIEYKEAKEAIEILKEKRCGYHLEVYKP